MDETEYRFVSFTIEVTKDEETGKFVGQTMVMGVEGVQHGPSSFGDSVEEGVAMTLEALSAWWEPAHREPAGTGEGASATHE